MNTRRRALADTSVLIGVEAIRFDADLLKDYELGVSAVSQNADYDDMPHLDVIKI